MQRALQRLILRSWRLEPLKFAVARWHWICMEGALTEQMTEAHNMAGTAQLSVRVLRRMVMRQSMRRASALFWRNIVGQAWSWWRTEVAHRGTIERTLKVMTHRMKHAAWRRFLSAGTERMARRSDQEHGVRRMRQMMRHMQHR